MQFEVVLGSATYRGRLIRPWRTATGGAPLVEEFSHVDVDFHAGPERRAALTTMSRCEGSASLTHIAGQRWHAPASGTRVANDSESCAIDTPAA